MSDSVRPHRQQPTRLCHPWDSPGKNTGVGCHFLLQCRKVKSESEVAQWVSDSSWHHGLQPTRLLHPWDFQGKSTGVGCHSFQRKKEAMRGERKQEWLENWLDLVRTKFRLLCSCPRVPFGSSLITLTAVYGTTQMTKTHDFSVHERGPEQWWFLRSQLPEQGQSHTRSRTETLVTEKLVAIGRTEGLHPPSPLILHVQYSFFLLVKRRQKFLKR